jgi:hypothetical protein
MSWVVGAVLITRSYPELLDVSSAVMARPPDTQVPDFLALYLMNFAGSAARFRDLDAKCQEQIRAIARTPNAIQTGGAAQDLVAAAAAQIRQ